MPRRSQKLEVARPHKSAESSEETLASLSRRVERVEKELDAMQGEMVAFKDELTSVQTQLKQIDQRSIRGEHLMLQMQLEQRRASKVIEKIAEKLEVPVPE